MTIHYDDEKLLHEKLIPCEKPFLQEDINLAIEMNKYLQLSQDEEYARKNNIRSGVGLAANQVGSRKRIIAIYLEDDKLYSYALLNPEITSKSVKMCYLSTGEGCLSVPIDHKGLVMRSYKVTVKAYDCLTQKNVVINAKGYLAICLQHEIDHLNGILYYDHIDKTNPYKVFDGAVEI